MLRQRISRLLERAGDGATILMWAAHWASLTIIERLLRAGNDVNARGWACILRVREVILTDIVQRRVFISYSRRDEEFARQLDASLLAAGVVPFLDQRDIRIGDSIPEKIYTGIAASSHLVYVLSSTSLTSMWVNEELSIAKMRQKQDAGFGILPLLIDDVSPPTGLVHIRYANFRMWRDPLSYRREFLELLRALGVEPRLVGRGDLAWYSRHAGKVREVHKTLERVTGELTGALVSSVLKESPSHALAAKWAFDDGRIITLLDQLYNNLNEDEAPSERLIAIRRAVGESLNSARSLDETRDFTEKTQIDHLRIQFGRVVDMLDDLRGEVELTLLAPIANPPAGLGGT